MSAEEEAALARLRRRAHVHTDRCYGPLQLDCAEHHAHDAKCWHARQHCRQPEEPDLVVLLLDHDRLVADLEVARAAQADHWRWALDLQQQLAELSGEGLP